MKRIFLALILGVITLIPVKAAQWPLEQVYQSVAYFQGEDGNWCSTSSPRIGQWLTAAHCVEGSTFKINGQEVNLVKVDKDQDLALFNGPQVTPLEVSKEEPKVGEEVALIGWPARYDGVRPLPFFGHVQLINEPDSEVGHNLNYFDSGGGRGMSGGPIVNQAGKLVGVVEAMSEQPVIVTSQMYSPTLKAIRKFLGMK